MTFSETTSTQDYLRYIATYVNDEWLANIPYQLLVNVLSLANSLNYLLSVTKHVQKGEVCEAGATIQLAMKANEPGYISNWIMGLIDTFSIKYASVGLEIQVINGE